MATNEYTEREARRNLQRYLRQLSYFDPDIPPPPIDGVAGESTTAAIRAFQQKYNLPVTGVADRDTWEAIYDAYRLSVRLHAAPACFSPFPARPDGYEVKPGDTGYLVITIQYLLSAIAIVYDAALEVEQNGVYDGATERAVNDFQARTMLPATGRTDRETWNRLVKQYGSSGIYAEP